MPNHLPCLESTDYKRAILFENLFPGLQRSFFDVKNDFRTFSDKSKLLFLWYQCQTYNNVYHVPLSSVLPEFVNEEEERATTFYLSLTTIAIFFSSITATTLQFSYQQSTHLGSAVNLSWFISLVFSVSSGINSLLSMVWRKSHMYVLQFFMLNEHSLTEQHFLRQLFWKENSRFY